MDNTIEKVIGMMVSLLLLMIFICVFPVYKKQQDLSNFSREVIRIAEIRGRTDIDEEINDLKKYYKLDTDDLDYSFEYSSFKDNYKIQINNPIEFNCKTIYKAKIMNPIIIIDIPLQARSTGRSEVYWK